MVQERVQKILASAGIASRRACEEFIQQGRVKVNGITVAIGATADCDRDIILFDNKTITKEKNRYVIFYKPKEVLSSVHDIRGTTIKDLVPVPERLYPVGRLDKDAEGLILLTNDGKIAHHLAHPSFETKKTYLVTVQKKISQPDIVSFYKGVSIENRIVKVHHAYIKSPTTVELTLHEGRKHIVKRLLGSRGYWVTKIVRTRLGILSLGKLTKGQWRDLTSSEVVSLKNFATTKHKN